VTLSPSVQCRQWAEGACGIIWNIQN